MRDCHAATHCAATPPDVLPDSLPKRGQEPDVLPDGIRRRDQPDLTPDSLPPGREPGVTDTRPDGGVAEHPIHDEDQEDLEPEDYEREVNQVAARSAERRAADEELGGVDEFTTEEIGPCSIPPERRGKWSDSNIRIPFGQALLRMLESDH